MPVALPIAVWALCLPVVGEGGGDLESETAELSIALPQNGSSFADEERPQVVLAGRHGVEWPEDYRLFASLRRLDASG